MSNLTTRIIGLPATSLAALNAKVAASYFWGRNGGFGDTYAAAGFKQLAHAFCADFASRLDTHFAALEAHRDAQPSAQIAL